MNEKEKIKQYLDYKKISKNRFYSETGLSIGFLDSGNSLGVDKARIIINKYPDINLQWLVMDNGEMIADSTNVSEQVDAISFMREQSKQIADLNARIIELTEEKTRYKILYEESKKDAHSDASANANAECVIVNVPPTGTTNR